MTDQNEAPVIFYHGTKADLKIGDLLSPGYASNFGQRRVSSWIYFAATLEAAIWGAELAEGEEQERIYVVEPMGDFIDDPNLTDKKFLGNPTKSYRSREAVRIVAEVIGWIGHPAPQLHAMRHMVERRRQEGVEAID